MELCLDKTELMSRIKEALKSEIVPIIYDTNIQPLIIEHIDNSNIVFQCDGSYIKDVLENRYSSLILHTIKMITNKDYTFSVHSLEEDGAKKTTESPESQESVVLPTGNMYKKFAPRIQF